MDEQLKDRERSIEKLKLLNEEEDQKLSLAQKKALEHEARKKYGRDWKKILGYVKALKPDPEVIHDLYGVGLGHLRDLNDPRRWSGK